MTPLDSDSSGSSASSSAPEKSKIGGASSTPAVRNLAKQYGVDINDVPGTGKDGRVLKEDVISYAMQKGIINETPAGVQLKHSEISPLVGGGYEDRTLQLRLVTNISRELKLTNLLYCFHMLLETSECRCSVVSLVRYSLPTLFC